MTTMTYTVTLGGAVLEEHLTQEEALRAGPTSEQADPVAIYLETPDGLLPLTVCDCGALVLRCDFCGASAKGEE